MCLWCTEKAVTEKPVTVVIVPSNKSIVRAGDTVSCSVGDSALAADNYTWTDSATGDVIRHGAEWTIKPCPHQSCTITGDDGEMIDNCINATGGLVTLECHVTVGMATASEAVVLYVTQPGTTCNIATTAKGILYCISYIIIVYFFVNIKEKGRRR